MLQRLEGHKPNSAPAWHRRLFLAFLPLAAIIVLAFVLVQPASAAQFVNTDTPVSGTSVVPCTGENVTFSGFIHLTTNITTTDNPVAFHLKVHENVNLNGVGDQGNTYVVNFEANDELNATVNIEQTVVQKMQIISSGSAPNYEMSSLFHITIVEPSSDLTITALVDHFDSGSCTS